MSRRRSRRTLRRSGILLLLCGAAALALGAEEAFMNVLGLVFGMMLLMALIAAYCVLRTGRWLARGMLPARAGVPRPRSAPLSWSAPPDWATARRRFAALRSEYAAHECDPLAVLRLPALTDVRVPSTARFVDAFAEAQALDTDREPPLGHAVSYATAVDRACRAWQAARDAADRIRLAGLSPAERNSVQRVIKLLTMARDSGHEAERLTAYAKAREELTRLETAGVIHLPRTARAALTKSTRGRLPA